MPLWESRYQRPENYTTHRDYGEGLVPASDGPTNSINTKTVLDSIGLAVAVAVGLYVFMNNHPAMNPSASSDAASTAYIVFFLVVVGVRFVFNMVAHKLNDGKTSTWSW